jgi:hypothetical protein
MPACGSPNIPGCLFSAPGTHLRAGVQHQRGPRRGFRDETGVAEAVPPPLREWGWSEYVMCVGVRRECLRWWQLAFTGPPASAQFYKLPGLFHLVLLTAETP